MICDFLKQKRREKKLSLRGAAEKIGISHTTLYYIESGKYEPRFPTLAKLLGFYQIGLNELLREGGEHANG